MANVWCIMSASRINRPIFSETINSHQYVTYILTPFLNTCPVIKEPMPFLTRQYNSSQSKQFYALFTGCFWRQNKKHENVALSFTRRESTQFLRIGKDKEHSNNPCMQVI